MTTPSVSNAVMAPALLTAPTFILYFPPGLRVRPECVYCVIPLSMTSIHWPRLAIIAILIFYIVKNHFWINTLQAKHIIKLATFCLVYISRHFYILFYYHTCLEHKILTTLLLYTNVNNKCQFLKLTDYKDSLSSKLNTFPLMCATDKVWITELNLIH